MSRQQLGFLLLFCGIALIIGATVFAVRGIQGTLKSFEPVATFASPGEIELTIAEAETYTLWHDYQTWYEGRSVGHPPALPSGFTFALESLDTGAAVPFSPLRGSQNLSLNSREASGIGTFQVPAPGAYRLTASNATLPAESDPSDAASPPDVRIFSLSRGRFLSSLGGSIGFGFLAAILGFLGLALAIGGVLMLTLGRRKARPPTHSTS